MAPVRRSGEPALGYVSTWQKTGSTRHRPYNIPNFAGKEPDRKYIAALGAKRERIPTHMAHPHSATRVTGQMWSLTIEPSQSTIRPRLHSNAVLVYSRTGYNQSCDRISGPFTGVASIEYFTPRWQTLFLSMSAGEVKRVWLLDPGEPVLIFDVKLKNVLPVK
jgi:hypothetical protein